MTAGTSFGPRSLLSLGYNHVGVDDGWQQCASNSHGFAPPYGYGYHDNTSGLPIPNTAKFPNMSAMTARAKALGVRGTKARHCNARNHHTPPDGNRQRAAACVCGK